MTTAESLTPIARLNRDLRAATVTMSKEEARFLVDAYYQMQGDRIRSDGRVRALNESGEPHSVLLWLAEQSRTLEAQIKGALQVYAKSHPVGQWMLGIKGIGPVIAAGFLAHLDVTKANTCSSFWKYAGQDPSSEWKKGEKRPWNASLKRLCWIMASSMVKFKGHDDCYYGKKYEMFKAEIQAKNAAGEYKDYALGRASSVGKGTEAYKHYSQGVLPPGHVNQRALRKVAKLFLSHLHAVMYRHEFGKDAPKPYALEHLEGHNDYFEPPS